MAATTLNFTSLPPSPHSMTDNTHLPITCVNFIVYQISRTSSSIPLLEIRPFFILARHFQNCFQAQMLKCDSLNKKLSITQRQLNDQGEKLYIIQMLGGLLPLINQRTPFLGMLNDTKLTEF